jgi:lysophospholipase L1-like esterase
MLARFERDVAHYQPHIVIITTGGNDCNPTHDLPTSEFEANLGELVTRCRRAGVCAVILQTYYAIDVASMKDGPELARRFPEYMDSARKAAAREDAILFDHFARWERLRTGQYATYARLMRDPMHLNSRGNMVMGLDALRWFGAPVAGETAERCAEGLAVQRMMDELSPS